MMTARGVSGVLLVSGLVAALSGFASAGEIGTVEGVPGDGFLDFYIDLMPYGAVEDPGSPGSWIDTDGNNINTFVLQSQQGIFDGPQDAILEGWFQSDNDNEISDGLGYTLDGTRYLGDIIRPQILPALVTPPDCWTIDQFLEDLTVTYSLYNAPGIFYGDVIVTECIPEPSGLVLLGMGAVGLMASRWRRQRVVGRLRVSFRRFCRWSPPTASRR